MPTFSSLQNFIDTITARFSKPRRGVNNSEGITAAEILQSLIDTASFSTAYGNPLLPNSSVGKIPQLSDTYQLADSALAHFIGLGGGVRLDGAWRLGNNSISKTELFLPTAHASNRYETNITLPKGNYGSVTLSVTLKGLGASAGMIRKVYTFDTSTNSGAASTTHVSQGDITAKLFLGEPDWSGVNITIPIHEKTASNVAKIYVMDLEVVANTAFLTPLLTQTALLSAVTTTARSTSSSNTTSGITTQMSVTADSNGLKLHGDVATPNASQFYGTNAAGTRGWYDWLLMQSLLLSATPNRQPASYALTLADAWGIVEMNVATANTLTIPPNSSVAFPVKTQIMGVQYGAGQTTLVAGAGVNLRSPYGRLKFSTQYSPVTLMQVAINEWYVWGDTTS